MIIFFNSSNGSDPPKARNHSNLMNFRLEDLPARLFEGSSFSSRLLTWYDANKRDLPWRDTSDPYRIWISEIILQQTRVEQGLSYYHDFIARFPDIQALAGASDETVMKVWQGLGYYSRARNLHAAARQVVGEHGGKFPDDYQMIRKLSGIGDYTAAAVASIAFGLPYPVIDGNVLRFMTRLQGIAEPAGTGSMKRSLTGTLGRLMDKNRPGDFNQAVMEFGATVCTPGAPACHSCIFREACQAFRYGLVGSIPVKTPRQPLKKRYFYYLVLITDYPAAPMTFLRKRTGRDIWRNLYEFPLIESSLVSTREKIEESGLFRELAAMGKLKFLHGSDEMKHLLTHRKLLIRFYIYECSLSRIPGYEVIPAGNPGHLAVPRPVDRFFREHLQHFIKD